MASAVRVGPVGAWSSSQLVPLHRQGQQQHRGSGQPGSCVVAATLPSSIRRDRLELGRQRRFRSGVRRESIAQRLALGRPRGHPARLLRVRIEVALHLGATQRRELAVDERVQSSSAIGSSDPLISLSAAPAAPLRPCSAAVFRARETGGTSRCRSARPVCVPFRHRAGPRPPPAVAHCAGPPAVRPARAIRLPAGSADPPGRRAGRARPDRRPRSAA